MADPRPLPKKQFGVKKSPTGPQGSDADSAGKNLVKAAKPITKIGNVVSDIPMEMGKAGDAVVSGMNSMGSMADNAIDSAGNAAKGAASSAVKKAKSLGSIIGLKDGGVVESSGTRLRRAFDHMGGHDS